MGKRTRPGHLGQQRRPCCYGKGEHCYSHSSLFGGLWLVATSVVSYLRPPSLLVPSSFHPHKDAVSPHPHFPSSSSRPGARTRARAIHLEFFSLPSSTSTPRHQYTPWPIFASICKPSPSDHLAPTYSHSPHTVPPSPDSTSLSRRSSTQRHRMAHSPPFAHAQDRPNTRPGWNGFHNHDSRWTRGRNGLFALCGLGRSCSEACRNGPV
jgi:hypothetical protein